jgi:hypothetical protein
MAARIPVYLESGTKRTFAGAVEWPGWCVSAHAPEAALQALLEAGPRYERIVSAAGLSLDAPGDVAAFDVVERLQGNATTDFGAPAVAPAADARPLDAAEVRRQQAVLQACWHALAVAAAAAAGKELRKGPRGGGRDLDGIVRHVEESERGYLSALGWRFRPETGGDVEARRAALRSAVLEGVAAAAGGRIPAQGPRGRAHWPPRYFVRRAAWHAVEHAWEIEDRALP